MMAPNLQNFARTFPPVRRIVNRTQYWFTRFDGVLLRTTKRSLGGRAARAHVLLLTTTGRRTGQARTTPLVYVSDGENFLVLAAYGGSPWNPHWLANLRHDPRAEIQLYGHRLAVTACEVSGRERDDLWPHMRNEIRSLAAAERRTDRLIPLVRFTPVQPDSHRC